MRHDITRYLNECSCTMMQSSDKDAAWKSPLCQQSYGLLLLSATLSFYLMTPLISRYAAKIITECQDHSKSHNFRGLNCKDTNKTLYIPSCI